MNTALSKLDKVATDVVNALRLELQQQGHTLTGALEESISYEVESTVNSIAYVFSYLDYGKYVNRGVPASKIPSGGRTGRGGVSDYITALIEYGRKRRISNDDKELKNFAFAVAEKHKKEDMPTKASSRFSKNGKRTMFQGEVLTKMEKQIPTLIDKYLFSALEVYFSELV